MSFIVLDAVRAAKEAVLSKLAELLTATQGTGIKSVQRLRVSPTLNSPYYTDVTISAVNPLKAFVLCRWSVTAGTYMLRQDCELINATTLRCTGYRNSDTPSNGGEMDIQIVEFK